MSNYSHRGYEQRSGGYGRRRHKAAGFNKKPGENKAAKSIAVLLLIASASALIAVFAKNIKPFVDSFDKKYGSSLTETSDTATADSPDRPYGDFDKVDKNIFVSKGSGYLMFKGTEDTASNYAATINGILSSLNGDIRLYNMVIPTNTEFGINGDMSKYTNSQKDNLERIKTSLMDNVNNVDLYNTLKAHKNEYIYFRTDESLTALGGYYIYREFAQNAGFAPQYIYSIQTLSAKKGSIVRFEGSFIKRTSDNKLQPHGNQELFENADSILYYRIPVNYSCNRIDLNTGEKTETNLFTQDNAGEDPLSVFPAKDTALLEIVNEENSGDDKLLIVKDHSAEPVIGYLVPAYKEIHVTDVSLYKNNINEYIRDCGITHVLVINGIDNANNSLYCQRLRDLFDSSISS